MRFNFQLIDKDNGMDERLKKLAISGQVSVGIFDAEGSITHKEPTGRKKKTETSLTVADVATNAEFGIGQPERSWPRDWFDINEKKNRELLVKAMRTVASGKWDIQQAFEMLGLKFQGSIQKRIAERIPPPNAPATIAAKGSDVPLIDTGQLRSSITYKAETK